MTNKDMSGFRIYLFPDVVYNFRHRLVMCTDRVIFKLVTDNTWITIRHKMKVNWTMCIMKNDWLIVHGVLSRHVKSVMLHHFTPEMQSTWAIVIASNC